MNRWRKQLSNRGSAGVAILLSKTACKAWSDAASEMHNDFDPRILAIRLLITTSSTGSQGIFLVSAYAPDSKASTAERDSFLADLENCISRKKTSYILLIGADINACLGISTSSSRNNPESVGSYGLEYQNDSGKRFLGFLQRHNLSAITTFFLKPERKYITWCSPIGTPYQIDHIITSKSQLVFFQDAAAGYPSLTATIVQYTAK